MHPFSVSLGHNAVGNKEAMMAVCVKDQALHAAACIAIMHSSKLKDEQWQGLLIVWTLKEMREIQFGQWN